MFTWLPYPSYTMSAKVLDRRRLAACIRDSEKIYNFIIGKIAKRKLAEKKVVMMWKPYPYALALYHDTMVDEWVSRKYVSKKYSKKINAKPPAKGKCWSRPEWLLIKGDEDLLPRTHRAALLKIKPKHYGNLTDIMDDKGKPINKWTEKPKMDLYYPITASTKRDTDDEIAEHKPFVLKNVLKERAKADRAAARKSGHSEKDHDSKKGGSVNKQSKSSVQARGHAKSKIGVTGKSSKSK